MRGPWGKLCVFVLVCICVFLSSHVLTGWDHVTAPLPPFHRAAVPRWQNAQDALSLVSSQSCLFTFHFILTLCRKYKYFLAISYEIGVPWLVSYIDLHTNEFF